MLRRVQKIYGFTVRAKDDDVGEVHDLYFDDESWAVRYFAIDTGSWLFGRRILLFPTALEPPRWEEQVLPVALTREQVENSPDINLDKPVSRQQLVELHEYYGWPAYWAGSPLLGTATVGVYPTVLAGAEAVEEEVQSEDGLTEKYRGDPNLRSTREVIGYHIQAQDGEIGHVEDFFISEEDWVIRYIFVDTRNWLPGRKVLVSPSWIEEIKWGPAKVYVDLSREQVKHSPEYDPSASISREYETDLHRYYGRPGYWI
jgi:hypothetical protein